MNSLNLASIAYISFRLAPFILVSFFSISSILNQDLKGLMYICGLLLTTVLSIIAGNTFKNMFERNTESDNDEYNNATRVCNLLTLSDNGPISNIPLSQVVFSYTFGYLVYIIQKYGLYSQNVPTLLFFPLLMAADFYWNSSKKCVTPFASLAAMLLGIAGGAGWAGLIDSLKITKLQYFSGLSNTGSCSAASKQTLKCTSKPRNT